LAGLLSTGTALATALAGVLAPALPVQAAPVSSAQLQALEAALNSASDQPLSALLQAGPGFDPGRIEEQRRRLRASFPDARWSLSPGTPRRDGRPTVRLSVTGSRPISCSVLKATAAASPAKRSCRSSRCCAAATPICP
jgi:hypothetical protein